MTDLIFMAALYNEEDEVKTLIESVKNHVDGFAFCDDGSTDDTAQILTDFWWLFKDTRLYYEWKTIEHTGLPETVKNQALNLVPDGSWVLMLDADERLDDGTLQSIRRFIEGPESIPLDYVYFKQVEVIDGQPVKEFQKAKLFRKEAVRFPLNNIHADDQFVGNGDYRSDWVVLHRKSSTKQIVRETEYLLTYKKLLDEGKIDEGRYRWLAGLHHYVRPHG